MHPLEKKKSIYIKFKKAGTQKGLTGHQIFITDRGVKCWGGFYFNCLVTLRLAGVRLRKIPSFPNTQPVNKGKSLEGLFSEKGVFVLSLEIHMKTSGRAMKEPSRRSRQRQNKGGASLRVKLRDQLKRPNCLRSSSSFARERPPLSGSANEKRSGV